MLQRHLFIVCFASLAAVVACGDDGSNPSDTGGVFDVDEDAGSDATGDTSGDAAEDATGDDAGDADRDGTDMDGSDRDASDAETDGSGQGDATPEHTIFELREREEPATLDTFYASEETTRYRVGAGLDAAPTWVSVAHGRVFAGMATGVAELDLSWGAFVTRTDVTGPVLDVLATDDGIVFVQPNGVLVEVDDAPADAPLESVAFAGTITQATAAVGTAFVSDGTTLWRFVGGVFEAGPEMTEGASMVAGTDAGLWLHGAGETRLFGPDIDVAWPSVDALYMAGCPNGDVLLVHASGLEQLSPDGTSVEVAVGPGGIPTDNPTAAVCGADWWLLGHAVGASALARDGGHTDHYQSQRWLQNDAVIDVALQGDTRWFATAGGITRVDLIPRTLAGKAGYFLTDHDRSFWRLDGFSSQWANTPSPWSEDGLWLSDDDNDGQWTQEMIGALVYAAAATGDDSYCDRARPAVQNMLTLVDMPCLDFAAAGLNCGFFTRSFVREDEGRIFDDKATQSNWHLVEYEGQSYYWKDDTSTDEYGGHYYGLPLFFDVCATDAEKEAIAMRLTLATDHLIDNDYDLIDLDGGETTYGTWGHDYVASCVDGLGSCDAADRADCFSACFGGGFINAAEILGHLLVTWHVTQDDRFYHEYIRLRDEERYGEVIVFNDNLLTAVNPTTENNIDHELSMLAFHSLIRYEPDPVYRARWQEALLGLYSTEIDEENPFWAGVVAGLTGHEEQRAAVLDSLREYPMDRRWWRIDHSHRLDYVTRAERDREGNIQLAEWPPPYDEQPLRWWDQTPYAVTVSGNGTRIRGPMAYLIAYWAMRYYGQLDAPAPPESPLLDGFQAIAHRGGGRLAPEATLPAYYNAVAVGASVLECDAHATSDGVLVCIHDDTVNRTTDGTGAVRDMTFAELRALDAGYHYSADGGATHPYRGTGVVVPTLAELLQAFPDTPWSIEVKQQSPSIARDVVDLIELLGRTQDVVIASFFDATIAEVRQHNPDLLTALTIAEMAQFFALSPAAEERYRPPGYVIQASFDAGGRVLDTANVERAHRLGMRIHVWTVNDRATMEEAIERGADGVFTDDPALLSEVLDELGD